MPAATQRHLSIWLLLSKPLSSVRLIYISAASRDSPENIKPIRSDICSEARVPAGAPGEQRERDGISPCGAEVGTHQDAQWLNHPHPSKHILRARGMQRNRQGSGTSWFFRAKEAVWLQQSHRRSHPFHPSTHLSTIHPSSSIHPSIHSCIHPGFTQS